MATLYRTVSRQSQKSQRSKHETLTPSSTNTPDLARMTTTNTTTGVLNHLTEQQEQRLVEFKELLQKDGWWTPDGVNGKPSHDDGTLLRYLRARKFDVQGAIGQFTDTEKWLKEQKVEELYEHFDVDFYERARLMYPQWTGHRDKRGIPIYVFEIKGLDVKNVDKYQKESAAYKSKLPSHKSLATPAKLLPLFALYHNLLNFVLPFCSSLERPRPEVPVTNSTNIVDISGVSLRQFWNLKNHMQDASVLATAHYPETLDRIFIIGAPAFFPTVWSWIKRWFDPVTVSKIFILGRAEVKPTLEKFMDPSAFPKKYGGTLDWNWGDIPHLDDETRAALERDGNKGWVRGPALWLNDERIVVGSDKGVLRRSDKEIAEKKPIVYKADFTEDPVHPEKRASLVGGRMKSTSIPRDTNSPNGTTLPEKTRTDSATLVNEPQSSGDHGAATAAATAATVGTAVTAGTSVEAADAPLTTSTPPEPSQDPTQKSLTPPANIPADKIRTSPMGDSQVHLPDAQPAPPAVTAEYISGSAAKTVQPETKQAAQVAAASASDPPPASVAQPDSVSPPPGHTQPGPLPEHTAALNKAITEKLQPESTITIPASTSVNGDFPHPDIVSASDPTKGLALEAEKLALHPTAEESVPERPHAERFVTALEIQH